MVRPVVKFCHEITLLLILGDSSPPTIIKWIQMLLLSGWWLGFPESSPVTFLVVLEVSWPHVCPGQLPFYGMNSFTTSPPCHNDWWLVRGIFPRGCAWWSGFFCQKKSCVFPPARRGPLDVNMSDRMSEYICIYVIYTSRWYVRSYVRIVCHGITLQNVFGTSWKPIDILWLLHYLFHRPVVWMRWSSVTAQRIPRSTAPCRRRRAKDAQLGLVAGGAGEVLG